MSYLNQVDGRKERLEDRASLSSQIALIEALDSESIRLEEANRIIAQQRNIIAELQIEVRRQRASADAFTQRVAELLADSHKPPATAERLPAIAQKVTASITPEDLAAAFSAYKREQAQSQILKDQVAILLEKLVAFSQATMEAQARAAHSRAMIKAICTGTSWRMLAPVRHGIRLAERLRLRALRNRLKGHFDDTWYAQRYPDVALLNRDPLAHFMQLADRENRNPSPYFDTRWYLVSNPDVRAAGVNSLVHFVRFGMFEGRDPHPHISVGNYRLVHKAIIEGTHRYPQAEPDELFAV